MEFEILELLTGEGADVFNYFFTIVLAFGGFAFGVGCLVRILSRS